MHTNAMQINRAVFSFYALTGQFDERGSNVLTASLLSRPVDRPELLVRSISPKASKAVGTVGTGSNATLGATPTESAGTSFGLKYQFDY